MFPKIISFYPLKLIEKCIAYSLSLKLINTIGIKFNFYATEFYCCILSIINYRYIIYYNAII